MFLVEASSVGIVSFACVALNLESLNRGHGRSRLLRDLDISRTSQEDLGGPDSSMGFEQDLKDLANCEDFEGNFKDVEDSRDFDDGFKDVDGRRWINVETGSSNVLDEEVSSLLLGSRPAEVRRNSGCGVSLLRTRSGGSSEEGATETFSRNRNECQLRVRNAGQLNRNSVMKRPSLDFDKMQRTCFGHRFTENGVKRPRFVRIRSLGRLSSVLPQQRHQATSVTLDPSAFTFRSLSLRHGLKMATPTDRPSRAF